MFEVGRLCMKVAGREAGKYCIVVKRMDDNFVMVTGPRELTSVKRRRCNINHLEPLMETVKIKSDAPDSDVMKAYQEANLLKKLDLVPGAPSPGKQKPPEKKPEKKPEARKEAKPEKKPEKKPEARKEAQPEKKSEKKPLRKAPAPKKKPAAEKPKRASAPKKTKKK